jgi:pyruvate/2-oxoglutarate dehydrogenase complex dihydrolipoamide acyltransferase (E2) component
MSFGVAEVEVDVSAIGGAVLAAVVRAAAEAVPFGAAHIAAGLGGPVIRDAGDLGSAGIVRRLAELGAGPDSAEAGSNRAGSNRAGSGGATLTVVESELAAETVPPEPEQLGTLVVGAAAERVAVVRLDGGSAGFAARSVVRLVFSYDHRVLRRDDAVRFLSAVERRLEAPWTSAA